MATKVAMKHKDIGNMKDGYFGFSWTTLFFGFFPALFRGDFITFIGGYAITLIILFAMLFTTRGEMEAVKIEAVMYIVWYLPSFIWAFMYNKHYSEKLLERGYVFADSESINAQAAGELEVVDNPKPQDRSNLSADTRKCPFCAESVKIEAKICKHCQSALPEDNTEVNKKAELAKQAELEKQAEEQLAIDKPNKKREMQLLEKYSMGNQLTSDEADFLKERGVSI